MTTPNSEIAPRPADPEQLRQQREEQASEPAAPTPSACRRSARTAEHRSTAAQLKYCASTKPKLSAYSAPDKSGESTADGEGDDLNSADVNAHDDGGFFVVVDRAHRQPETRRHQIERRQRDHDRARRSAPTARHGPAPPCPSHRRRPTELQQKAGRPLRRRRTSPAPCRRRACARPETK